MNKKGFTLVEMLAVIVLLGIISSIVVISVTRYRKTADEKEKISLRQNIISAFDMYRIDEGYSLGTNVALENLNASFSYSGKVCNITNDSKIKVVSEGNGSKKEIYCVNLYCDGNIVIDDYSSNTKCN